MSEGEPHQGCACRAPRPHVELRRKGNPNLRGKTLFHEHELDLFASAIRRYAEMGFGLDVVAVAGMMTKALRKAGRSRRGHPIVVSASCTSMVDGTPPPSPTQPSRHASELAPAAYW